MREVTIEWRIQSKATRNRCFKPDFPISGGEKHFWKEIINFFVNSVESYSRLNSDQLDPH